MGGWLLSSEGEHVFSCTLALFSRVAAKLPRSGGLGRGEWARMLLLLSASGFGFSVLMAKVFCLMLV